MIEVSFNHHAFFLHEILLCSAIAWMLDKYNRLEIKTLAKCFIIKTFGMFFVTMIDSTEFNQ